jgi:hypothetical protein
MTTTIEGVDTMPLPEVRDRLNDEFRQFAVARQSNDVEAMQSHYARASQLAARRDALTASAAQPVTAASAPPAVPSVVVQSTAVTPPDSERVDRVDDGWSERCNACRLSYHDKRVKLARVRASGVVVKLCPACRARHPGLLPA